MSATRLGQDLATVWPHEADPCPPETRVLLDRLVSARRLPPIESTPEDVRAEPGRPVPTVDGAPAARRGTSRSACTGASDLTLRAQALVKRHGV
jgi:hypothetical protein